MGGSAHAPYRSTLVIRNDASELARMAEWIVRACTAAQLSHRMSFALQLCLDEATANIITHGEGSTRAREIIVSIAREGTNVVLTVDDDGGPFDVTSVAPPTPPRTLDDTPVGGLGIELMRQFSSNLEYRRDCGRNQLRLTFVETQPPHG